MIPERDRLIVLFEGAPRFIDRLMDAAPYADDDALLRAAREIAHAMPEAEQIELIDAHPRLGAARTTMSRLSVREQGTDRDAPGDLGARLAALNDAYEARFGFRYCVFVAGRTREALLPGLEAALAAERPAELERAIDAVIDIAIDRQSRLTREVAP